MLRPARLGRAGLALEAVPRPPVALLGLALLNVLWGGSLPATKLALASFGPLSLAAARLGLSSALFLLVLGPSALSGLGWREGLRIAALGVVGFTGTQVLQAVGTAGTSGAAATVLASTGPLWIALLAPAVLREAPRPPAVLGMLLALAGLAMVLGLGPGGARLEGTPLGGAVVLLSSGAFALYTLLGKQRSTRHPPLLFAGVSCLGGLAATLPLAVWETATLPPAPSPLGWAMLGYLAVLVTFVGMVVWFWGLRAVPAARAGALLFLQPLSGLALSALVLGDPLTPSFLGGAALVLLGIYLAARR